ncbi:DUF6804 family protein [Acinetobacter radioresistens]|uniref:DUF6804 family protein n=1 Tax=Acinetobacter radioresistens TaxID=40216 RepID=UPI00321571CC
MKQHHLFYVAALVVALGVLPLPYGYYQLLRFIAFFAFAIACFISFNNQQKIIPFFLGFAAIVFNPFLKIVFPKEFWAIIDLVAGIGLAVWTYNFYKARE